MKVSVFIKIRSTVYLRRSILKSIFNYDNSIESSTANGNVEEYNNYAQSLCHQVSNPNPCHVFADAKYHPNLMNKLFEDAQINMTLNLVKNEHHIPYHTAHHPHYDQERHHVLEQVGPNPI